MNISEVEHYLNEIKRSGPGFNLAPNDMKKYHIQVFLSRGWMVEQEGPRMRIGHVGPHTLVDESNTSELTIVQLTPRGERLMDVLAER